MVNIIGFPFGRKSALCVYIYVRSAIIIEVKCEWINAGHSLSMYDSCGFEFHLLVLCMKPALWPVLN
jgi:hypothetical protein